LVPLKNPKNHDICQNISISTLLGTPEKSIFNDICVYIMKFYDISCSSK
jgi:hypothetical protein